MDQDLTCRGRLRSRSVRKRTTVALTRLRSRSVRKRAAITLTTAVVAMLVPLAVTLPQAQAVTPPGCHERSVPVTVPGIPDAHLYGKLCMPDGPPPDSVQLLVHGATYTNAYWDWPQQPETYSYVQHALAAGQATFAVDRLGAGKSTRPLLAAQINFTSGAEALHDVIVKLRSGDIAGGHQFTKVLWVGHSAGSAQAWAEAEMYPDDINAYVITGVAHQVDLVASAPFTTSFYPASIDPKFLGSVLDPLYLTTLPGRRTVFYDTELADPDVIARDEQLKDTWSTFEMTDISLLSQRPAESAASQAINVPTFIVLGEKDIQAFTSCDEPDPFDCEPYIAAAEAAYYGAGAEIDVAVVPGGHDVNLHPGAPSVYGQITDWINALSL